MDHEWQEYHLRHLMIAKAAGRDEEDAGKEPSWLGAVLPTPAKMSMAPQQVHAFCGHNSNLGGDTLTHQWKSESSAGTSLRECRDQPNEEAPRNPKQQQSTTF
eukprot:jgi/Psemu1/1745/gm1.1745_g